MWRGGGVLVLMGSRKRGEFEVVVGELHGGKLFENESI